MIQAPNMNQAFGNAYGQTNQLGSTYGGLGSSVLPQAQQTAQNLYNNPYATGAMTGATGAANMGAGAANTQYNTGAGLVNTTVPYAQQVAQNAFDPQNALYAQQQNLTQQQVNAQNAASGVGATPYGAGVADQALGNFNIAWQNNQLQREQTGANTINTLGQTAQTGTNMMSQAPTTLSQTSAIPYATYSGIGTGQDTALSQLLGIGGQGANIANMPISDLLQYLGIGNQTTSVANQTAQTGLNQSQLAFNQYGTLAAGGLGLAGLSMFL
jgi:hypothetical protein